MDDTVTWVCFGCGQAGHLKSQCKHPRQQSHPPAPGLPAGPDQGTPQPPPVPPRRPESEIADPAPWADSIRRKMGWSYDDGGERNRTLAMEQVSESRMTAAVSGIRGRADGPPGPAGPVRPLPRWTVLLDDPVDLIDWLEQQKAKDRQRGERQDGVR